MIAYIKLCPCTQQIRVLYLHGSDHLVAVAAAAAVVLVLVVIFISVIYSFILFLLRRLSQALAEKEYFKQFGNSQCAICQCIITFLVPLALKRLAKVLLPIVCFNWKIFFSS